MDIIPKRIFSIAFNESPEMQILNLLVVDDESQTFISPNRLAGLDKRVKHSDFSRKHVRHLCPPFLWILVKHPPYSAVASPYSADTGLHRYRS